jgi:hypothetical protein
MGRTQHQDTAPSDARSRQRGLTGGGGSTYVDAMTVNPDVAEQATSQDPAVGLRAVAALRRLADQLEALQVSNARAQGWSWDAIGALLGVSKQAVHKKHAGRARRAGRKD